MTAAEMQADVLRKTWEALLLELREAKQLLNADDEFELDATIRAHAMALADAHGGEWPVLELDSEAEV